MEDSSFYKHFRDAVINMPEDVDEGDRRVEFLIHHYKLFPKEHEGLIFSITRSFPTVPVYVFLDIGMLGTNIAR